MPPKELQQQATIRKAVGLALGVLFVATLLGLAVAWSEMSPTRFRLALMLVGPAFITLATPILIAMRQRPYDIFHPLNFVALSFFFGVFGRVLYVLSAHSEAAQDLLEGRPIEMLIPGAILSATGSVLLCTGFVVAGSIHVRMRTLNRIFEGTTYRGLSLWLPFWLLVSLGATYLFLRETGFQYDGFASLSAKRRMVVNGNETPLGYHRLLAQGISRIVMLILISMWFWPIRRSIGLRLWILTFSLSAVALPFMASSRVNVLLALIAACVAINRLKIIQFRTLLLAVAACVVILTCMLALRRENQRGIDASESIVNLGLEPLFGNKNFACVVKLSHIYDGVPDLMEYKYGQSYLGMFYAPIPRTLWEDKPAIRMGREITEKIYHRGLDLRDKGGGTPPGMFAEAIINFSVYLFPLFVFLVGLLFRILDNSLKALADQSPVGTALYAGIMPGLSLELMSGDFVATVILTLSVLGILVAICILRRLTIKRRYTYLSYDETEPAR
ncbi:O-antigen polymerase [Rhodopirellula halodulae]|uniref:O-antigen polymerase n=1 Tax=Rhodopirellula halodulae TaxID=2894198 RepID=UPI001E4078FB|nr:O-antigen polymerase [Rhodopirellula sp. JC737]MCC9654432.1 oligosaccharide repeat unit polymerase [Rhodopirellula sp. JC737]